MTEDPISALRLKIASAKVDPNGINAVVMSIEMAEELRLKILELELAAGPQLRVWDRALTPAEIEELYMNPAAEIPGEVTVAARRCSHPVHDNPGLVAPCPECGADDAS